MTKESNEANVTETTPDKMAGTKGKPTPTRKQSQSNRAQPLVANSRRPVSSADKAAVADARERARQGYAAGEDKFLPARDKGPQRRFVRDFVDARTSLGEWMLPLMIVIVVTTFIDNMVVQSISLFTIWGYLAILIVDSVILGTKLKRALIAKFGAEKLQPGFQWYAIMRSIQIRKLRMPKTQVKRGQYPR